MAAYPEVSNGTGTRVFYWLPGKSAKKAIFPMRFTALRHSGITTTSMETTHLNSPRSSGREFGGRTFIVGKYRNPGQLTMEGYFNPQNVLPQEDFFLEIVYFLATGFKASPRWVGFGHLQSIGDISVMIDETMKQTIIYQYSGNVSMIAAKQVVV